MRDQVVQEAQHERLGRADAGLEVRVAVGLAQHAEPVAQAEVVDAVARAAVVGVPAALAAARARRAAAVPVARLEVAVVERLDALVLQAVLEGQGVALGWQHLTAPLVERGLLLRPLHQSQVTDAGFYIVWPKGQTLSPQAATVRDWILAA